MHIGLIGFGSIGRQVYARLSEDPAFSFSLLHRSAIDDAPEGLKRTQCLHEFLAGAPSVVVECAGHSAVSAFAIPVLRSGRPLVLASVGALADERLAADIHVAAQTVGARLILPSGAIGGLDILRAIAADGSIDVQYKGVKPPAAWKGSPADRLVDLDAVTSAVEFFSGTGREAATQFPKNANVVAALALAGAGFDRMRATLVADPDAKGNTHYYQVSSPHCSYEMRIEGAPNVGNARTSQTTALSIIDEIRRLCATLDPSQNANVVPPR